MAYRVVYSGGERYPTAVRTGRYGWTGPVLLAGALIALCFISTEAGEVLEKIMFPGGKEVFMQLEAAAQKIQEGEPVAVAIDAFCRQVISGVPV